ncbi:MAG: GNAT family N-acetyltransferase [Flavobacteriales bacterium]
MQKVILNSNAEIVEKIDSLSNQPDLPITQWKELLQISSNRRDQVFFLAFIDNNHCFSGAIFSEKKRRIAGLNYSCLFLYGYDFFDFNSLHVDDKYAINYTSFLQNFAQSKGFNFLTLENLYQNNRLQSSFTLEEEIALLDNSIDDFSYIYSKKGVKRDRNTLVKKFNYQVKHFRGQEINEDLINQLANLHKERWAFDNVKSSFFEENRKVFYNSNTSNKLLTIIYADDDILAMHYGMIVDKKLIFHTPVINIKYYQYSPMAMLLFESAIFCEDNHLNEFNLGLGDESYKNRFTNSFTLSYTYHYPLGTFNKLRFYLLFILSQNKSKLDFLFLFLKKVYRSSISLTNKLCFYNALTLQDSGVVLSSSIKFSVCSSFPQLVEAFRNSGTLIERYHYNRIMNKEELYFLSEDKKIICYGWSTKKPLFVSEKNKTLDIKDGVILYDFFTYEEFRNNGFYQKLLKKILTHLEPNSIAYIYALKSNIASNKAILKTGFQAINSSKIF